MLPSPSPIKRATAADVAPVAATILASRKQLVDFAPLAHSDAEVREWVSKTLIPKKQVYVYQRNNKVLGVIAFDSRGGDSWIDQLFVSPAHVRTGIGSALLTFATKQLEPPIFLYSFQQNTGAREFYEVHGFIAIRHSDGAENEERCPDVLYQWDTPKTINVPKVQIT